MNFYTRHIATKNGRKFIIQMPAENVASENDAKHQVNSRLQFHGFLGIENLAMLPTKKQVEVSVVMLPEES